MTAPSPVERLESASPPPMAQPEVTIDRLTGETAPLYQVRLTIGWQSFTVCQPRETEEEAKWLAGQFVKALTRIQYGPSPSAGGEGMREELLRVARLIEGLKRECGMDPESPTAIQNGRYMSIAAILRGLAASPSAPAEPSGLTAATASVAGLSQPASEQREVPMHMTLCEFGWLIPRPNQTYIAVHIPGCEECDRMAADQRDAYGSSSPTVAEDGSLIAATPSAGEQEHV